MPEEEWINILADENTYSKVFNINGSFELCEQSPF